MGRAAYIRRRLVLMAFVLFGVTIAGQDISFESLAKHQKVIAGIVRADPNVADTGAFALDGNQAFVSE